MELLVKLTINKESPVIALNIAKKRGKEIMFMFLNHPY